MYKSIFSSAEKRRYLYEYDIHLRSSFNDDLKLSNHTIEHGPFEDNDEINFPLASDDIMNA